MLIDLHLSRRLMAWGLGLTALTPFLFCLEAPAQPLRLSSVSGRVTRFGHPITKMLICFDADGVHSALGSLQDDGSFQLVNFQYNQTGAFPGRYHAHLTSFNDMDVVPAKYHDPRMSGLEINVATDWNYLDIELH
jgi:hypothetical protein